MAREGVGEREVKDGNCVRFIVKVINGVYMSGSWCCAVTGGGKESEKVR